MTDAPKYQADGRYQLPLYVTEGEIIKRAGWGIHAGRKSVQQMRLHPKFPPKDIGGKRYWPSVVDFLDVWNGRQRRAQEDPAIAQNGQGVTQRGRRWHKLEAAKEWLAEREQRAVDGNERWPRGDGKVDIRAPDGRTWVEDPLPTDLKSRQAREAKSDKVPKRGRKAKAYWDAYMQSPLNKRTLHKPGWVFVLAPDGGNWIEKAKPTDPEEWRMNPVRDPLAP